MASECKLRVLLGATFINSLDGNPEIHAELHARQVLLIGKNDNEKTIPRNERFTKQRSKKSALLRLSRELVNIHGKRDSGIKCSQCEHSIQSQRFTSYTASNLINHACVHLNKDLFACRHCDLKFVTQGGICMHLRKIHSLSGVSANYIGTMGDHQSDIIDMLKVCFGKAPQKQLNVTAFGKQKKNNQGQDPLLKLAYGCLEKHQHVDRIECSICPSSIPKHRLDSKVTRRLLDHARWHLDKPIFTCHLCKYSASTQGTIASHLNKIHSAAQSKQNFNDRSSEYFEEISSMMEDCFGEVKKERPPVITKQEKRMRYAQSIIRSRCGANSLMAERQIRCSELTQRFHRSAKLECRICHAHLTVMKAAKAYMEAPMQHALVHFNQFLFSCRRCSYTSTTKIAIGIHVRRKHCVPVTNEFDDRTDDFHADFMDILSKCYDWDLEPNKADGVAVVAPMNYPCNMIARMHGNDLKIARHVHVSELIRNHAKDGKILCRICSHRTKASSNSLFYHATAHLDSRFWPYRCKLCSFITVYQTNTHKHLKKMHKDNDAGEIKDMSDKFHLEIMEVLSKCYDWSLA